MTLDFLEGEMVGGSKENMRARAVTIGMGTSHDSSVHALFEIMALLTGIFQIL